MSVGRGRWAGRSGAYAAALLLVGISLFYLVTLAPAVLWGDHGLYQRYACEGTLQRDGGGHWLWLQFARLFTGLPIGSVAYRVNLLSAVAAVVTLIFLVLTVRALGLSWTAAVVACASLAVSHTFWMHAVRAEVYPVFTAIMALQLWLWLSWRPDKVWPLHLAAGLYGVALLGHQMAILFVPAALFLLWQRRDWLSWRDWGAFLGFLALGTTFFVAVVCWQTGEGDILRGLQAYFLRSNIDFSQRMFDFSLSGLPRDAAMWLGLLGLQFAGPAALLGLYGLGGGIRRRPVWLALLIFYATGVLFAFSYRVNDSYVFYLPSYLVFCLLVARGWQRIEAWPCLRSSVGRASALFLIIAVPIATYWLLAGVFATWQFNPLGIRTLPGREPNRYFLWPASNTDLGADVYARIALGGLAPDGVIIADHTPIEPLRYLQCAEGLRPDVQLVKIEPGDDLGPLIEAYTPERAVYLADDNPEYYDLSSLEGACIEPTGDIYRVAVDVPAGRCP